MRRNRSRRKSTHHSNYKTPEADSLNSLKLGHSVCSRFSKQYFGAFCSFKITINLISCDFRAYNTAEKNHLIWSSFEGAILISKPRTYAMSELETVQRIGLCSLYSQFLFQMLCLKLGPNRGNLATSYKRQSSFKGIFPFLSSPLELVQIYEYL